MKKSKIMLVAIVALLSLCAGLLTACEKPVDHEEAFKLLKANYEASIKYEIFYTKELTIKNDTKEIRRVNSVYTPDKGNTYTKDANGNYRDHAIQVYSELDGQMQFEVFVGLSKDGKKDPGKNLKFNKKFIGKNDKKVAQFDYTYSAMTPSEYLHSDEFAPDLLSAKLSEIGRLQRADVVFDKKGAVRTGELTKLKFSINNSYYEAYHNEFGTESMLKAKYISMELLYGRIAKIAVMNEEEGTESIFGASEYESYKLEIVYLGPEIQNLPNYNEVNSDKQKVWKEI